jgi:hypothetical protein
MNFFKKKASWLATAVYGILTAIGAWVWLTPPEPGDMPHIAYGILTILWGLIFCWCLYTRLRKDDVKP